MNKFNIYILLFGLNFYFISTKYSWHDFIHDSVHFFINIIFFLLYSEKKKKNCLTILCAQYFASLRNIILNNRWKLKDIELMSAVKPLLSSVCAMCQSSPLPPSPSFHHMPSSHSSWLRSDRVGFDLQAIHSASDSNNLIKALFSQIDASKEACIKSAQTSLRYFDISTKEKKI